MENIENKDECREVFIVQGNTGEYSNRSEWQVCAYEDKQEAINLATELNTLARIATQKLPGDDGYYNYDWEETEAGKELLQKDPEAQVDYTGLDYSVYPVKLIAARTPTLSPDGESGRTITVTNMGDSPINLVKSGQEERILLRPLSDANVEAVARAICEVDGGNSDPDKGYGFSWKDFILEAKAAISAMRAPEPDALPTTLKAATGWDKAGLEAAARRFYRCLCSANPDRLTEWGNKVWEEFIDSAKSVIEAYYNHSSKDGDEIAIVAEAIWQESLITYEISESAEEKYKRLAKAGINAMKFPPPPQPSNPGEEI